MHREAGANPLKRTKRYIFFRSCWLISRDFHRVRAALTFPSGLQPDSSTRLFTLARPRAGVRRNALKIPIFPRDRALGALVRGMVRVLLSCDADQQPDESP